MSQAQTPPPAVRTVGKGQMSEIDAPRQATVRSAAEWSALWKTHDPQGSCPRSIFRARWSWPCFSAAGRRLATGSRLSGRWGTAATLVVEYVETAPSRDAITAQILTAPYHLAAIPKHDGEVRFQKVVK